MKRRPKKSSPPVPRRSPKLPDELHPIVDAVVEVVFERLRSVATRQGARNGTTVRRKTAKLDLPLPKQRKALAEALADLLLADLASRARGGRPKRIQRSGSSGASSPRRVPRRR